MPDSSADRNVVEVLAEEFVRRYRTGERPPLSEYTQRYPEHAEEIEDLFPALLMMENLKPAEEPDAETTETDPELKQIGDFRILREAGRGGMGVVYEAEQMSLGRRVAVKVLPHQMLLDQKHKRRFEREAKAAAKLHHTNIVPVFGVGEQDGMHYYVMQFIQGLGLDEVLDELRQLKLGSLRRPTDNSPCGAPVPTCDQFSAARVARSLVSGEFERTILTSDEDGSRLGSTLGFDPNGSIADPGLRQSSAQPAGSGERSNGESSESLSDSLSLSLSSPSNSSVSTSVARARRKQTFFASVANIGRQVASALQYAHEQGITHRDIKPSNLLLDMHGTVWVTDFGLAKANDQDDITHTGDILGTLRYMPPEAFEGRSDVHGDQYSLGLTLYELIAQRPAFEERDRNRLIKLVTTTEPQRIERLNPEVPRDLATIIHKSIERNPSHRYTSAKELGEDLQRFLDDEPINARRISKQERLARWCRRNQGLAASLAAVCVLLLVINVAGPAMTWWMAELNEDLEEKQGELSNTITSLEQTQEELEDERDRAVYSRYVSNIPAAQFFLRDNAIILARSILRSTPLQHRNFEWAFLANRAWPQYAHDLAETSLTPTAEASQHWMPGEPQVLREIIPSDVAGGLNAGCFSSDGESVFLAVNSGVIKQFSVTTGDELSEYTTDTGSLITTGVSQDGRMLAGFTFSSRLTIWDVERQELWAAHTDEFSAQGAPWVCRWSNDRRLIASAHMGRVLRIWDVSTSKCELLNEWQGHEKDARDLFISPDRGFLLSASLDKTICKWSIPGGDLLATYSAPIPPSNEIEFQGISPSGRLAVTVCNDGSSFLWNIESEELLWQLSGQSTDRYVGDSRFAVSFSRDESCVAVMTDRLRATIYEVESGRPLSRIAGHGHPLRHILLSPDGSRVLTFSEDNRARIWACIPDSPGEFNSAHDDAIFQIDIDPAGIRLLTGSFDQSATIWNLETQRRQTTYRGHEAEIVAVDLSPNGDHAATLDSFGYMHVWDIRTGRQLFAIDPMSDEFARNIGAAGGGLRKNMLNFPAVMSTGLFSPDGEHVVAFQGDSMKVFDAETGEIEVSLDAAFNAGWPVYSHDSTLVAILEMWSDEIGVWDLHSGRQVARLSGHREPLVMIDFSPSDDRLASCVMESKVIIWDGKTGQALKVLDEFAGAVTSCRFSADGELLLIAYADSTAGVWDAETGEKLTTLIGHSSRLRDVQLSPDQTRLVTWAMDDKAIVWDLAPPVANQLLVLNGESQLLQARWTPDGRDIVVTWGDGSIEVWSGASQQDVAQFSSDDGEFKKSLADWRLRYMNVGSN